MLNQFDITKTPINQIIPSNGRFDSDLEFKIKINENITGSVNSISIDKTTNNQLGCTYVRVFLYGKTDTLDFTLSSELQNISDAETVVSFFSLKNRNSSTFFTIKAGFRNISFSLNDHCAFITDKDLDIKIPYKDFYACKNKFNNILFSNDVVYNNFTRDFTDSRFKSINGNSYLKKILFKKISHHNKKVPYQSSNSDNYHTVTTYFGDIKRNLYINKELYNKNFHHVYDFEAQSFSLAICKPELGYGLMAEIDLYDAYKSYCYNKPIKNQFDLYDYKSSDMIKIIYKNTIAKHLKQHDYSLNSKTIFTFQKDVIKEWGNLVFQMLLNASIIS